jgi:predicted alpha/beta superfamily hydrolase
MKQNHLKACLSAFICLLSAVALKAQAVKNNQIVLGVVDSVHSKILNETRKLWIYTPTSVDTSVFSKEHYPVIYLLDGDKNFAAMSGIVQYLSEAWSNTVCPKMIIVAILTNANRGRDLTPTNVPEDKMSGGGEKFTEFMESELFPHIDSTYATAPCRILIGHSLGGLMVINTLIHHPQMFNGYIAVDPSMWWDSTKLLNQARQVLKDKSYAGKSLYLGIANTMPEGMDTLQVRNDTSGTTKHIRAILTLRDIVQADSAKDGLNFDYKYYKEDEHLSVPLITEYDALRFFFRLYDIPASVILSLMSGKGNPDVIKHIEVNYHTLSEKLGCKILPSEFTINFYGNLLLHSHKPEEALPFFEYNASNYPQSYNVYNGLGDCYVQLKNNAKAIEYYQKALSLKENKGTRDKLNKLTATQ